MTTVLIVDDSAVDRRLVGGILSRSQQRDQWEIVYAHNGCDALEKVESHIPDVVITDMQMPEMDGLQLVANLKKEYPLIPVVLMTAQGSEDLAVEALHRGAASYIPKRRLKRDLVSTLEMVYTASLEDRSFTRLMIHRMTEHRSSFVLDTDLSLIPALVNYLQQAIRGMKLFDESERLRVGVALEEALLNAFYHGNLEISSKLRETDYRLYYDLARARCEQEPYRNRHVYVDAELSREGAVFTIRDEGPGFDLDSLPDPTDPANLDRPSGRGLLLMYTFMSEVRYNETGNVVTLIKRHKPTRSTNGDGEDDDDGT
ncbi:MAG: response regulator [Planctomycetes bacterium]|nr:response regulator [Planctomycetota bacterium]